MKYRITADDAIRLAKGLHVVATEVADRLFANWSTLKPSERTQLENVFWSLSNASTDVITMAVGIIIETSEISVAKIATYTNQARQVVKTTEQIKKAIRVATAVVGLAAAIASKDPGAIVKNAEAVYNAAQNNA